VAADTDMKGPNFSRILRFQRNPLLPEYLVGRHELVYSDLPNNFHPGPCIVTMMFMCVKIQELHFLMLQDFPAQGDDAEEFNPDRFIDEQGQLKTSIPRMRDGVYDTFHHLRSIHKLYSPPQ
jgi:hypothetical protein